MSNMSYCRFRNTLSDLLDCQYTIESLPTSYLHSCLIGSPTQSDSSIAPDDILLEDEAHALKDLVACCQAILRRVKCVEALCPTSTPSKEAQ